MAAALIVCGDARERATYREWLCTAGYCVAEAASHAAAVEHHRRGRFPLTLADAAGAKSDATMLIQGVRAINPRAALLMLGAADSVDSALAALRAGATDVLLKPIDRETLLEWIRVTGMLHEGLQATDLLRDELRQRYAFTEIIAHSSQMLEMLVLAGRVAVRDTTVLITGESGTGKDLLARAIHANSRRAARSLVSINCAAIPETLLESELFGYRRGAFTGAQADKPGLLATAHTGTLFLDEIAELPLPVQAKLLRFLQDGMYSPLGALEPRRADVRVIAATNAPLPERVEAGTFRRDLYYRLAVFPIHIAPLRERREDIIALAHHFLQRLGTEAGKRVRGLSREAVDYLVSRSWPGNVRELANAIERAAIVSAGGLLTSADFGQVEADGTPGRACRGDLWDLPDDGVDLPALNRALIASALTRKGRNMSAAARMLGLTRPTLRYRMKKYGIAG